MTVLMRGQIHVKRAYWVGLLLWSARRSQAKSALGVTLLEVIAATLMATIAVSAMLLGLVNFGQASRDERVLNRTQSEIEIALDFIGDELNEAVFVYNGQQLDTNLINGMPGIEANLGLDGNDNLEPVLVFWKSEPIPYEGTGPGIPTAATCAGFAVGTADRFTCDELRIERRSYTLVAYLLDTAQNATFQGQARIRRFELRKYADNGQARIDVMADRTPGYVDPQKESSTFESWPYDDNGNLVAVAGAITVNGNNAPVLVDFIDDPGNPDFGDPTDPANARLPICEGNDVGVGDPGLDDAFNQLYNNRYIRTPQDLNTSFFACVRTVNEELEEGNQDTVLYIRGNPDGRDGYRFNPNGATPLPSVQTQVVSRGTVDKFSN